MTNFFNIGSVIAGFLATTMGAILWWKQYKLSLLKERIRTLEDFCKTVYTTHKIYKNIIVMGPRASGKSSIVSLWSDIKKLITKIKPTNGFDTYEYKLNERTEEPYYDDNINVKRIRYIEKVFKIFDYAGEDNQIANAVKQISESNDCTVILVFNSDLGYSNDNKRYFSRSLIENIHSTFNISGYKASAVKKVYVVFNKIDIFSSDVEDYDKRLEQIKKEFADNIAYIESIFGYNVYYMVTSAKTNHNVLNLLQKIVNEYE